VARAGERDADDGKLECMLCDQLRRQDESGRGTSPDIKGKTSEKTQPRQQHVCRGVGGGGVCGVLL
jgi:hypothetical protein